MPDEIDPHPRGSARFVGQTVSFDWPDQEAGGKVRRLSGVVESARYIGRTTRGAIPDHELTIRGRTGKKLTVSLVESRASFAIP